MVADARMGPAIAQINALNKAVTNLGLNSRAGAGAVRQVNSLRDSFLGSVNSLKGFQTTSVQIQEPVRATTEALRQQDLSVRQWSQTMRTAKKTGGNAFRDLVNHQLALRKSLVTTWSNKDGIINADVIYPKHAQSTVAERLRASFGTGIALSRSFGAQMVKTGKDIQWQGRQLTVGLTVPMLLAGRAAVQSAIEVDKALTRLGKVYDFTAEGAAKSMELMRRQSLSTAKDMTSAFGQTTEQTLEMMITFAQMGKAGEQLDELTRMSSRIAFLGETDQATAVQATRAVMDAFQLSTEDTAATLDRFNQIENNTVLSIQDLANELPDVAGTLANFGFQAEHGAAMLAALKERAVPVNEAVTAMRTGMSRIFAPTDRAQKKFEELGIDLRSIAERHEGDPIGVMYELADAMEGVGSQQERLQYMVELFDRRQADKWLRLFDAMDKGSRDTGAFAEAMRVAGMNAAEAAQLADREIRLFQESSSGQLQILGAEIKALGESAGRAFLPVAIRLAKAIKGVMGWFDGLSDRTKNFIRIMAGIAFVAGPVTMLAGLLLNLGGTFIRVGGFLGNLVTRFAILNESSWAARAATKLTTAAMSEEAVQMSHLTGEVERLTAALTRAGMAQQTFALKGKTYGNALGQNLLSAPGGGASMPVRQLGEVETKTRSLKKSLAGVGSVALLAAGSLLSFNSEAGSTGAQLGNMALMAGIAIPAIQGMVTGIQALAKALVGAQIAAGPLYIALAAIAAAVYGVHKWLQHMEKSSRLAFRATENAQAIAESLGEQWHKNVVEIEKADKAFSAVDKWRQADPEVAAQWKDLATVMNSVNPRSATGDQLEDAEKARKQLESQAVQLAVRLKQHTDMTPEEIHQQVQAQLDAVGAAEIKLDLNFDDQLEMAERLGESLGEMTSTAMNIELRDHTGFVGWIDDIKYEVSNKVKDIFGEVSTSIHDAVAFGDQEAVAELFNQVEEASNKTRDGIVHDAQFIVNATEAEEEALEQLGIDLADPSTWHKFAENSGLAIGATSGATRALLEDIGKYQSHVRAFGTELADAFSLEGTARTSLETATDMDMLFNRLGDAVSPTVEAYYRYSNALSEAEASGLDLTKALREELWINAQVEAGTYDRATAEKKAAEEIKKETAAAKDLKDILGSMPERKAELVSGIRENLSNTAQSAVDLILGQMDMANDAEMDSMQDAADAEAEVFDDRIEASDEMYEKREKRRSEYWDAEIEASDEHYDDLIKSAETQSENEIKAINEAADARIKRIEDQIAAEERADRRRQYLFDRERARLDYMSGATNRNIEFNLAMATGDFGQAAIVRATAESEEQNFYLDEQDAAADFRGQNRAEGAETRIEAIDAERDADIEANEKALKKYRERMEAEKKLRHDALEDQKEVNLAAIKDARETANESLSAAKDAAAEQRRAEQEAAQESYQYRRAKKEQELADLIASIPHTKAGYERLLRILKGEYEGFGGVVQGKSNMWSLTTANAWSNGIQAAARAQAEDANWEVWGQRVGNKIIQGMLGMNIAEWQHWVKTGKITEIDLELRGWERNAGNIVSGGDNSNDRPATERDHAGGLIGRASKRSQHPFRKDEVPIVAQKGEFMLDRKTVKRIGVPNLRGLQKGRTGPVFDEKMGVEKYHQGGLIGGGITGYVAELAKGAMYQSIAAGVATLTNRVNSQIAAGEREGEMALPPLGREPHRFLSAVGGGTLANIEGFDGEQEAYAAQIISIGKTLGATNKMIIAALEAAIVESGIRNLNYGDRDSVGIFQQRPSQDWGSIDQIMNPQFAITSFFRGRGTNAGALDYPNLGGSAGVLAQTVQRSAYPDRYNQNLGKAQALFAAYRAGSAPGGGGLIALGQWLESFGFRISEHPFWNNGNPITGGHSANSLHYSGRAIDINIGPPGESGYEKSMIAAYLPRVVAAYGGQITQNYHPANDADHDDHWHIAMHRGGLVGADGFALPQLYRGGKVRFDNTVANLHRGETVLTSRLSSKLENGMVDNSARHEYNLHIHPSPGMDVDKLADVVVRKIKLTEARQGTARVVN
jgi:TP901 family phage tail tape measure protein